MRNQSRDTPVEVERILLEGFRRMSPSDKLRRVCQLNRVVRGLAAARIRSQFGHDISERELKLRLAALRLDRRTMIDAFHWDPEENRYLDDA